MFHAIYLRTTPKRFWQLSEAYRSPLSAQEKAEELKKAALFKGFEKADVKIKTFEKVEEIPEYIRSIKDEPVRMN
jgi:hypothetical protein